MTFTRSCRPIMGLHRMKGLQEVTIDCILPINHSLVYLYQQDSSRFRAQIQR